MDNISIHLSNYGIRPSVQRIAIMRYLRKNRTHPSVDEIFEALKRQIPTLSKTTVYNTLNLFVENGAALYVGIDEKSARFDGYVESHAHFSCNKCGRIIDLQINIDNFLPNDFHGDIENTYFYLKGLCENCKKKNS